MQEFWAGGTIRLNRAKGLFQITLNRPDKANALTKDMLAALVVLAKQAADMPVLVLTGAGGVFSAGADLEAAKAGLATSPLWEELSGAIADHPGLTIAALNGTLAGGAMGMALACDLRISVPTAKFFYPVMSLGFLPQPSDPARLAALVGPARAKLILMGGAKIDAKDALRMGLVERLVALEEMEGTVSELANATLNATADVRTGIKSLCS